MCSFVSLTDVNISGTIIRQSKVHDMYTAACEYHCDNVQYVIKKTCSDDLLERSYSVYLMCRLLSTNSTVVDTSIVTCIVSYRTRR